MSTQLTIREPSPHEYAHIATLLNALYAGEGASTHLNERDVVAMMARTAPRMQVLLATYGTHIAGAILYYDGFDVESMCPGYHIADMVVEAGHRRSGIGRKLLQEVALRSAAQGGAWMSLTCLKENHVGNKFYQALGFQLISVQFYAIGARGMEWLVNDS